MCMSEESKYYPLPILGEGRVRVYSSSLNIVKMLAFDCKFLYNFHIKIHNFFNKF